jgi:3-hydroxyacyl-[acyl-carrier-protein] dehydratase
VRSVNDTDIEDGNWSDAIYALGVLAHRFPFLLVDRLRVVEAGRRALGLKRVTGAEWFGIASTNANPEMPGLLVVEALAQTSAGVLLGLLDGASGAIGYFAAAERVRFRALPRAGDTLLLSVELVWFRRGVAKLRGVATVSGRLAVSAEFTAVVRGRAA